MKSFILQSIKVSLFYVLLPVIVNQFLIAILLYVLIGVTHIEGTVMALVEYANLDMDQYGVCAVLSVIAYVFLGYLFVLPNGTT